MKPQLIILHGGHTLAEGEDTISYLKNKKVTIDDFKPQKDWKDWLGEVLAEKFEVLYPEMNNSLNSRYLEWKTWFEKLVPFLRDDAIFIGHSLGALFLAKYFSENIFPKKIKAIFMIAAPFDGKDQKHSLGTFALNEDFQKLTAQVKNIFIYHSKDDPVVPFSDFEKYQESLPMAKTFIFSDRGHFNGEKFVELSEEINNL